MTGVPQAIASTTLKPNGSSKSIRCSSARAPPSSAPRASRPDRAEVADPVAVERAARRTARSSPGPGRCRRSPAAARRAGRPRSPRRCPCRDGSGRRTAGSRPAAGAELERVDVDAVVDRRDVVERGVAVGVADRDVVAAPVVLLVDRHDPLGREAVDRRDHRRVDEAAVGQRQEVEAVVDEVELVGSLEDRGDVQALPDLGVEARILRLAGRGGRRRGARSVTESAVAKSVTSTPRSTSPSVSSEANCSHGP